MGVHLPRKKTRHFNPDVLVATLSGEMSEEAPLEVQDLIMGDYFFDGEKKDNYYNGKPVFRKQRDPRYLLFFFEKFWMVIADKHRKTPTNQWYLRSKDTGVDLPSDVKNWTYGKWAENAPLKPVLQPKLRCRVHIEHPIHHHCSHHSELFKAFVEVLSRGRIHIKVESTSFLGSTANHHSMLIGCPDRVLRKPNLTYLQGFLTATGPMQWIGPRPAPQTSEEAQSILQDSVPSLPSPILPLHSLFSEPDRKEVRPHHKALHVAWNRHLADLMSTEEIADSSRQCAVAYSVNGHRYVGFLSAGSCPLGQQASGELLRLDF